jgi:hypothetical protein
VVCITPVTTIRRNGQALDNNYNSVGVPLPCLSVGGNMIRSSAEVFKKWMPAKPSDASPRHNSTGALGGTPIGAPIVGWVANHFGPRWALGIGAVAGFAAALVAVYALVRGPNRSHRPAHQRRPRR